MSYMTMANLAKMLDPNGKVARIIDIMVQRNGTLRTMPFIPSNMQHAHRIYQCVGLPSATWRKFNQGILPSTGAYAQFDEAIGMVASMSVVDVDLVKSVSNPQELRFQKARTHINSIANEAESTIWYGSRANPEEIVGFADRYNTLSASEPVSQNIIDGGGTGSDNTSVWLIAWGEDQVTGVYPKDSSGGIEHIDYSEQLIQDVNGVQGSVMRAYVDWFKFHFGLAVSDYRFAVRICNLDVSNMKAMSSAPNLFDLAEQALGRLPDLPKGQTFWYMHRVTQNYLMRQAREDVKAGGGLTFDNVEGKTVLSLFGIPIELSDGLLLTEARVV